MKFLLETEGDFEGARDAGSGECGLCAFRVPADKAATMLPDHTREEHGSAVNYYRAVKKSERQRDSDLQEARRMLNEASFELIHDGRRTQTWARGEVRLQNLPPRGT